MTERWYPSVGWSYFVPEMKTLQPFVLETTNNCMKGHKGVSLERVTSEKSSEYLADIFGSNPNRPTRRADRLISPSAGAATLSLVTPV